jgi:hypothetical protein
VVEGGESNTKDQYKETGRWYEIPPTSIPGLEEEPKFRRASKIKRQSNVFATSSLPILKFFQVGESFTGSISTNLAFSNKDEKKIIFFSSLGCILQNSQQGKGEIQIPLCHHKRVM